MEQCLTFIKKKDMKLIRFALPFLASGMLITACGNKTDTTTGTSVTDTTLTDPTNNAMDYHPDQRQQIPLPDSSNTIGTDTISGAGGKDTIKK